MEVTFVAMSDIHHANWTNGLTEQDLLDVEQQVLDTAIERNADFILFGGDLFLSRNPEGWIRDAAHAEFVKKNKAGFTTVALIGNHDRDTKNPDSYHQLRHAKHYPVDLDKLMVIDERSTSLVKGCAIHGVPAGHSNTLETQPFDFNFNVDFNICVFHDLMQHSLLGSGIKVKTGINPATLDLPQFDIVLGGDNHVHQSLPLSKVAGWYIGAPVQHNWGDSGQERGIMVVTLRKERREEQARIEIERIPSKGPKFIHFKSQLVNGQLPPYLYNMRNNIIKITLEGPREQIDALNIPKIEEQMRTELHARSVKILEEPRDTFANLIPEMTTAKTPTDDWEAYLRSPQINVDTLSKDRLLEMGVQVLKELA